MFPPVRFVLAAMVYRMALCGVVFTALEKSRQEIERSMRRAARTKRR